MLILIAGLVIFLGAHSLPMARGARTSVVARMGDDGFRIAHSAISVIGFVLIVWGFHHYRSEAWMQVWYPPVWIRHITITLMWFAFVSLACMNPAPGRIRGWLRHPMLVAIKIWALAHLLANGDLGGMLLFGSFLVWAVVDRISVKRRGDVGATRLRSFTRADGINVAIGTVAYGVMIVLHPVLIGVEVFAG
jgi:uncharacterized membrane protein